MVEQWICFLCLLSHTTAVLELLSAECPLTLLLVQGLCALSQNGNGHSGIPRHLHTDSCVHPTGGIVGELWECEPFRYQQDTLKGLFFSGFNVFVFFCVFGKVAKVLKNVCFCQSSDINCGLTWLKSKGVSVKGPCTCSEDIIISPSLDHLSKSRFQPTFDLAVLLSLPLRDFGFSSPVIIIVKIHFII